MMNICLCVSVSEAICGCPCNLFCLLTVCFREPYFSGSQCYLVHHTDVYYPPATIDPDHCVSDSTKQRRKVSW